MSEDKTSEWFGETKPISSFPRRYGRSVQLREHTCGMCKKRRHIEINPLRARVEKQSEDIRRRARFKGMTVEEYLEANTKLPKRLRIDGISIKKHPRNVRFCPVLRHNSKILYQVFKDESLARSKEYYWNNLRKARLRVSKWKSNNPGLVSQQRYRRRSVIGNAICTLTTAQWEAIKAAYRYRCAYCGRRRKLTMDHIKAVVRDGHHVPENIIPACQSCNSSKGANDPRVEYQPHLIR